MNIEAFMRKEDMAMTIKDAIKGIGPAIKKVAKAMVNWIVNAKIESVAKVGVGVGAAVAAVIGIVKFVKMKKESYYDETHKSTVDDALELNFADVRNQERLHPLMKKVKKNLKKDLKPRYKKSAKKKKEKNSKEKYLDFIKGFDMSFDEFKDNYDEYKKEKKRNFDVLGEYELFLKRLEEQNRIENGYGKYHKKTRADWNLREVWENN